MDAEERLATYNRAVEASQAERWDQAAEMLETLVAAHPDETHALNLLGKVYFHKGEEEKAANSWHRVLRLVPNDTTAQTCLAALNAPAAARRATFQPIWLVVLLLLIAQLVTLWYLGSMRQDLNTLVLRPAPYEHAQLQPQDTQPQITDSAKQPPVEQEGPAPEQISAAPKDEGQVDTASPSPEPPTEQIEAAEPPRQEEPAVIPAKDLYAQAVTDYLQGAPNVAEAKFQELTQRHDVPTELRDNVVFWLGSCALAQGRTAEAKESLRRLLQEYPMSNKQKDAELLLEKIQRNQ